jgi:opacity protein-like surface antigen
MERRREVVFYAGPFGGYADDNVTSSSVWSVDWQTALRARVAYALTPTISVFGAVGPALGYARLRSSLVEQNYGSYFNRGTLMEVSYNNTYASSSDRTAWRPGLSVDVGLEAAVGNGVSFRAGYGMTAFQPISQMLGLPSLPTYALASSPSYTGELKATPLLQSARFGFIKRF